ncbi:MAG TPA: hypothetical protein VG326_06865 [Tepidisphaeraceae bacterium]|jgi:hypothetical protein|nr:hypothetical protein [Tepidisphaeraceae bacterium]
MSNNPPSIEIAAIRKRVVEVMDLMKPGNGTPWEDRGSIGPVKAYFQTVSKSLTEPALLLDHIRRPETSDDSAGFMWISAAMWFIGIIVWNAYWLYFVLPGSKVYEHDLGDPMHYWLSAVLQGAAVAGCVYLWVRFGSRMYLSLGAMEMKHVSPTLIVNVFSYTLGPSILAIIPIFGWIVAPIWIFADLIAGGKRRLYLKNSSAIINPLLILITALILATIAYFVVKFMWGSYLEMNGLTLVPPPKVKPLFAPPPPTP